MAAELLKKINLIILILLLILVCATTFGDKWLENYTDHVGLWQVCRQLKCSWMTFTPSYTVAFLDWWSCVRAFMVLSMMFTTFAILFQLLNIYREQHCHASVIRTLMVFNTIFLIIAVIVFVGKKGENYDNDWVLGWSFIIACFCLCLSFALVAFICICIKDDKRETQHDTRINIQPVRPSAPVVTITHTPIDIIEEKNVVELGNSSDADMLSSSDAYPAASGSDQQPEKLGSATPSKSGKSGSRSVSRRSGSRSARSGSVGKSSRSSFVSTGKEDYSSSEEGSVTDATTDNKDDESYTSESSTYTGSSRSSYTGSAASVVNTEFL